MITATVVGPVWSTKRIESLPPGAFLRVENTTSKEQLVALDLLGSGVGDVVLIAQGSAAAASLPGTAPVDALIVGVIDETTNSSSRRSQ